MLLYSTWPFLRIFQWRGQLRKGTSGRKGEVFPFGGSGGLPAEHFCIFELPRLDFLQFEHDFAHFQTRDITRGGQNPSAGAGATQGLGGGLWPLQYIC